MLRVKDRPCLYCGQMPTLLRLSENTVVMRCMNCWSKGQVHQSIGQGLDAEHRATDNWECGYQLQEFGPNLAKLDGKS